jgi:hypothetical protein
MRHRALAGTCLCILLYPLAAHAHGVAGKRFFPATIVVEDPFVADEAALPTISTMKESAQGDEPKTRETALEFEFAKRLTRRFGIAAEDAFVWRDPKGEEGTSGFENIALSARYQLFVDSAHEAVGALDLGFEIGGTGTRRVEADAFSTVEPAFFFGKGFGNLPDAFGFLRPFAVTGMIGASVPFKRESLSFHEDELTGVIESEIERHPRALVYGFTLQYSLPYRAANVSAQGLGPFARRLVPLVECEFATPLDGPGGARSTGTVNPGVLYVGRAIQIGLEAIIPINTASGADVGVRAQLHLYLDDLLPESYGKPLFGGAS